MGGIIKDNNIFSKNENLISKFSFLLVLTPLFLVFFSSLSYSAIIPNIEVHETGELNSSFFNGNFTIEPTGYNLSGFTIDISNYSYVNHQILDSTSVSQNYKINNFHDYSGYVVENITYDYTFNQVKQIINLTQYWNDTVNITVNKILPNNCLLNTVLIYNGTNFTTISYSFNDISKHLRFSYLQNKTKIFQVICNVNYDLEVSFTRNDYIIKTNKIFTNPIVFVNTNSYISAKKEKQEEYFNWENGSRWKIWFELFNNDELAINISRIHFWASNKTDNYQNWSPDKNYLYNTYISCVSPILYKGQYCEFNDTFYSKTTPVVWADVDYTILFNITGKGTYNYSGKNSSTQISGLFVELNYPIENDYVDTQTQINLSFSVTNYSNCSLYTNTTGFWHKNQTLNGIKDTNQFSVSSLTTGIYSWNVFCVDYFRSHNNMTSSNETFIANTIPRFNDTIPDLIFPEDTIFTNLNLSQYSFDVNDVNLSWTVNDAMSIIENLTININNDTGMVTIIPDDNFTNIRYVTFNVFDSFNLTSISNLILIDVTPVNDAPAPISAMPNLTILENSYDASIILDNYIWDADNYDWELVWNYTATKGNLTANTIRQGTTQIANISSTPEWNGIENLILEVCDAEYCRNTTITVTVLGTDQPLINSYNITNISTPWYKFVSLPSTYEHLVSERLLENSSYEFVMNITDEDYNDSINLTWFVYDLYDGNYNGHYKSGNDSDKNMNISFDWHDAGDYQIILTAKDKLNYTTQITWNIFVENKNRAPNKPQILFPTQNDFYTYNNIDLNWTLVTDPDESLATDYDIHDINYRLLIANTSELIKTILNIDDNRSDLSINTSKNATLFVDKTFGPNTDFYKLLDNERLDSKTFYAILIANDSQVFNYSDIITFEVDLAPEVEINRIFRNPAKINFHNVTINWTAYDDLGIQEKYVNITDPDGILIGTFVSDIKLHPDNITKNGTYQITAFAKDLKNTTTIEIKNFTVMHDINSPEVKLISPKLNEIILGINASVGGSGTVIFEYNVTDLSSIENCSLYLKHKFATTLIPWSNQATTTEIYDGLYGNEELNIDNNVKINRFVIPNLLRGQYTWNVLCIDNENNFGFARQNKTFELNIPTSKIEEEITSGPGEVSQTIPKYGLKLDMAQFEFDPYELITTNALLSTTQDTVTSIEIRTNVSWIIFDETYINQLSGTKDLLVFVNTNNLEPGNYSVEFLITAQQVSYKKTVTFLIRGSKKPAIEIPGINRLLITKSVSYIDETTAIVNISYNNIGYSRINLATLVDDLKNSKLISYDTKLSELNSNNELITKLYNIGIGEKDSFTYRLKDSNPDDIVAPKILEKYLSVTIENEINIPMITNINTTDKLTTEKIIFSLILLLVAVSVIAKIGYIYVKKK